MCLGGSEQRHFSPVGAESRTKILYRLLLRLLRLLGTIDEQTLKCDLEMFGH